jgi:hypothetical protein
MVYTSPRIAPPADRACGERSAQMPCQACQPKHKRPARAVPTCTGHCTAGQAATGAHIPAGTPASPATPVMRPGIPPAAVPAIPPTKASHGAPRRPVRAPTLVIAGLAIAVMPRRGRPRGCGHTLAHGPEQGFSLLKRGLSFGERTLGCFQPGAQLCQLPDRLPASPVHHANDLPACYYRRTPERSYDGPRGRLCTC